MKLMWIIICAWISGVVSKGVVFLPNEEQHRRLTAKLIECVHDMNQTDTNITGPYCERLWDLIMCWPDTPAGSVARQPCPSYINRFDTREFAFRECLPNGSWHSPMYREDDNGWTNFSACTSLDQPSKPRMTKFDGSGVALLMMRHIVVYRLMYNIGYGFSLVSLLLAVVIMVAFKKLHCPRNYIHINLFMAFLFRASMNMIRENVWVHGLGFPSDVEERANGTLVFKEGPHWECRLFYTVYQYVLMASYIWIFMEAVYLHMLIFVSVFTEKTRTIWYMLFGWSLPLPFAISWAVARAYMDNTLCWNTSTNSPGLTWINKVPVMVTVVLNFFCFINIVWLLFTKLSNAPCPDAARYRYRYKKLARSVLVLIPVFGVYYLVFTWPMDDLNDEASFVMLFIEMFFNSFQGLIIAILLCFVNGEVRTEIKKAWARHNLRRGSTVTRFSHMSTTHRKSSAAKVTDSSQNETKRRKHNLKSNTSFTSLEECVPLTHTSPCHGGIANGRINGDVTGDITSDITGDASHSDEHKKSNDELHMTIKIVNIECESKDGNRKNTTTLDISTMKNGRSVSASKQVNNNTNDAEFKDGDETTSFLDGDK